MKFNNLPLTPEMKANIKRVENLLEYLPFDEIKMMFYLRYIVDSWEVKIRKEIVAQKRKELDIELQTKKKVLRTKTKAAKRQFENGERL